MQKRMLIFEDDIISQRLYKRLFKEDFGITYYDDGNLFNPEDFGDDLKIILMDISLKGSKNGLTLTKEIKQNKRLKNIPIICITAHAFQRDVANAMEAGVNEVFTKPVDNKVLIATVKNYVEG